MKVKLGLGPFAMTVDIDFIQETEQAVDGQNTATWVQRTVNAANRADQAAARAEQAVEKMIAIAEKESGVPRGEQ